VATNLFVAEMSADARHSSPPPQRPKLIIQPAHPTPLGAGAITQLERDNGELKRQLQEQSEIVVALRRDLFGANARLSDVTGMFVFYTLIAIVLLELTAQKLV